LARGNSNWWRDHRGSHCLGAHGALCPARCRTGIAAGLIAWSAESQTKEG
jgi:hypothetical protein